MITDHIFYDRRTLQACSLTCRSWYIAALPHLHHTLKIFINHFNLSGWHAPIQRMDEFGLCPLIRKLYIYIPLKVPWMFYRPITLSPDLFNDNILFHFSALTNIRELAIQYMDVSSFFPTVRQYFTHFLPTVRSLTLNCPSGSSRQIVFFVGLFPHLEDLKLTNVLVYPRVSEDPTLVPPSTPPLRGRLTLIHLVRPEILKDIITLFGGIRFRYMDLYYVYGMQLILDAAAETLETLRLYPCDPHGEQVSSDEYMETPPTIP